MGDAVKRLKGDGSRERPDQERSFSGEAEEFNSEKSQLRTASTSGLRFDAMPSMR
jgi:hypothetical protein